MNGICELCQNNVLAGAKGSVLRLELGEALLELVGTPLEEAGQGHPVIGGTRLLAENPDLARRWRGAVGVTMARLLEHGYTALGFRDGGYVLKRNFEE